MSSFSCQYIGLQENKCMRLKADCVPGRPGCVLYGKVEFAVPAKQRIEEKLKVEDNSLKEEKSRDSKSRSNHESL